MPLSLAVVLIAIPAYLIGSLPFGLIVARLARGIDIRRHGSGNIGATNVARVLGAKYGVAVLVLDALKGMLPTGALPLLLLDSRGPEFAHAQVVAGIAAIVGHMFPCWIGFRGGKGVATSLGVVLVLAPQASLASAIAFAAVFAISRIVSLSSIAASIVFAAFQMWRFWPTPFAADTWSLSAFSLLAPALIIVRDRSNITRLLKREEPRFQFGKKTLPPGEHTASPSASDRQ